MKKSWILPNLGGKLSILNLGCFLMLIGVERTIDLPESLSIALFFLITAPIAFYWMLPSLGGPSNADIVIVPP